MKSDETQGRAMGGWGMGSIVLGGKVIQRGVNGRGYIQDPSHTTDKVYSCTQQNSGGQMKRSSSNANTQLSTRSQSLKTRPALQRDWSSDFHETFSRQLPWPTAGRTCWNYTCSERLRCTDPFTSVNFLLYFKCVWTHTPWCTLWKLSDICDVSTLFLPLGSFGDLTLTFRSTCLLYLLSHLGSKGVEFLKLSKSTQTLRLNTVAFTVWPTDHWGASNLPGSLYVWEILINNTKFYWGDTWTDKK